MSALRDCLAQLEVRLYSLSCILGHMSIIFHNPYIQTCLPLFGKTLFIFVMRTRCVKQLIHVFCFLALRSYYYHPPPPLSCSFEEWPWDCRKNLTLADAMYVQPLERLAAHLPYAKGIDLRQNSQYPGIQKWFSALLELPCYQKVRSDDRSIQLLFR